MQIIDAAVLVNEIPDICQRCSNVHCWENGFRKLGDLVHLDSPSKLLGDPHDVDPLATLGEPVILRPWLHEIPGDGSGPWGLPKDLRI